MAGLTSKNKEELAYIYELDEFRSFKKLCSNKRANLATKILGLDPSQPDFPTQAAMLQGQYYALEYLLLEMKKLSKNQSKEI